MKKAVRKMKKSKIISLFMAVLLVSGMIFIPSRLSAVSAEDYEIKHQWDFENGVNGWTNSQDTKVPVTIEAGEAETKALRFQHQWSAENGYDWDYAPIVVSPITSEKMNGADYLSFDFYLEAGKATKGGFQIFPIIQSPQHSYWFMMNAFTFNYSNGEAIGNGLLKYSFSAPIVSNAGDYMEPTDVINAVTFVTVGGNTDYSGYVYYDNIKMMKKVTTGGPVVINNLKVNQEASLVKDNKVQFSCNASGGTGEYRYAFYVLKDGKVYYKNETAVAEKSGSFVPYESGIYTILAYCFDSNGQQGMIKQQIRVMDEMPAADKLIALTFDDGSSTNTEQLLDILEEKNAKATFFILHSYAQNNTQALQHIVQAGHQLGNHTYDHLDLTQLSEAEVHSQIDKNSDFIYSVTGVRTVLYRPPYLAYNANVLNILNDQSAIGVSLDSMDWTGITTEEIVNNVINQAKDGDIVLMHDPLATTLKAVPDIIDGLRARGFEMVTVEELFARKGKTLEGGKFYSSAR